MSRGVLRLGRRPHLEHRFGIQPEQNPFDLPTLPLAEAFVVSHECTLPLSDWNPPAVGDAEAVTIAFTDLQTNSEHVSVVE